MEGRYNSSSCNFNNGGHSQHSLYRNNGYCCNCTGGNCRQPGGGQQMHSQSMGQLSCPGGNCCPGGYCPTGAGRSTQAWQRNGR
ncbi:hypothetical protein KR018_011977 [Drosophila ironensis]|nr:hypothetical protein KR018_011977 [Drosophila ironensis]